MRTGKSLLALVGGLVMALGLAGCQVPVPPPTVTPTIPSVTTTPPVTPTITPEAPSMTSTTPDFWPQPDSTPGTYYLGSRLGTDIRRGNRGVGLDRVGLDEGGWYAVLGGVPVHVGESHHFDGLGTITVLSAMPIDPLSSGETGGPGDTASVLYEPD